MSAKLLTLALLPSALLATGFALQDGKNVPAAGVVRAKQIILVDDDGNDSLRVSLRGRELIVQSLTDSQDMGMLTFDPQLRKLEVSGRSRDGTSSASVTALGFSARRQQTVLSNPPYERADSIVIRPESITLSSGTLIEGQEIPRRIVLSSESGLSLRFFGTKAAVQEDKEGPESAYLYGGGYYTSMNGYHKQPSMMMLHESGSRLWLLADAEDKPAIIKTDKDNEKIAQFPQGK
ncbi:MAG: hypothetical protein HS108_00530 [Planctomycetes bacterium]|nr:hypothetical protein [Planctomycetota bacterium]MCL4789950.1 hypothetical protein [Verrucomicrobiota bacterium]